MPSGHEHVDVAQGQVPAGNEREHVSSADGTLVIEARCVNPVERTGRRRPGYPDGTVRIVDADDPASQR